MWDAVGRVWGPAQRDTQGGGDAMHSAGGAALGDVYARVRWGWPTRWGDMVRLRGVTRLAATARRPGLPVWCMTSMATSMRAPGDVVSGVKNCVARDRPLDTQEHNYARKCDNAMHVCVCAAVSNVAPAHDRPTRAA